MEQKGTAIQLNTQGPNGGSLVLVVDFELKTASTIEVQKNGNIRVWDVQDYKRTGF